MPFSFQTTVKPEWIDYNGHMQDAFYGLVFSYAVDALQDDVGFDRKYREKTGHTIYLVEEHKFFLNEVKEGDDLDVSIHVIAAKSKLFHLYAIMHSQGRDVAISELVEMHVQQKPKPHGVEIPQSILDKLLAYEIRPEELSAYKKRSRLMQLK